MAHSNPRSTLTGTLVLLALLTGFAATWLGAPDGSSAAAVAALLQARTPSGSVQDLQTTPDSREIPLSDKQKREMLKSNFDRMKRDAKELADLAKDLQDQLDKSNENVLSLGIVDKADKIEKLARKIKSNARGY